MPRDISVQKFLASHFALLLAASVVTAFVSHGLFWASVAAYITQVAGYGLVFYAAGVQLGNPGIPRSLWPFALAVGTVFYGGVLAVKQLKPETAVLTMVFLIMFELTFKGPFILPSALLMSLDVAHRYGRWTDVMQRVIMSFSLAFAKYARDQRLMYGIFLSGQAVTFCTAFALGSQWRIASYAVICLVLATFILANVAQQGTRLPPDLQATRFVTLAYLRQMRLAGEHITRCQEMPPEAFGDVRKAQQIVMVSHRWLDRYSCDVQTDECPVGVKLHSMVERLNDFYAEGVCDAFTGRGLFAGLRSLFHAMRYGGLDVQICFDFICVPQEGKDSEGRIIERTPEEQATFNTILPAMGWCYTMFPTMVLPEVVPGVHPYEESGWCYSEFTSAVLLAKLLPYSRTYLENYLRNRPPQQRAMVDQVMSKTLTTDMVTDFVAFFKDELSTKRFFSESDRNIVAGFIESCLMKRRLFDAVRNKVVSEVQEQLDKFCGAGFGNAINDGLDASQNTLLHIAIRSSSVEVVKVLLQYGADPGLRNFWGDTPDQCFMIPRMSLNARLGRDARRQPTPFSASTLDVSPDTSASTLDVSPDTDPDEDTRRLWI